MEWVDARKKNEQLAELSAGGEMTSDDGNRVAVGGRGQDGQERKIQQQLGGKVAR